MSSHTRPFVMTATTTRRASRPERGPWARGWGIVLALGLCFSILARVQAQEVNGLAMVAALEQTLTQAIEKAEPSLVAIARVKASPLWLEQNHFPNRFRPVFDPPPDRDNPEDPQFIPTDFGSGVIIQIDPPNIIPQRTYILTNYHVVRGGPPTPNVESGANERKEADPVLFVRTHDGRGHFATIFAADPRSDLAVIVITGAHGTVLPRGDANRLKKGQFVLTMGNPYASGRDGSVSASWGMISNLTRMPEFRIDPMNNDSRMRQTLQHLGTLVQIDARLDLGTSGGAMLNLKGELIGLTTSLAALEGFEKSVGYAVPLDDRFNRVVDSLRQGLEVEYGFLGVSLGNAYQPPVGFHGGVLILEAKRGGPAEQGGLLSQDEITTVAGRPVRTVEDLNREIGLLGPGTKCKLQVFRRDSRQPVVLDVVLGKWPVLDDEGVISTIPRYPSWRGLRVDYSTARGKYSELNSRSAYPQGVLILEVQPRSRAQQLGLVAGSRIIEVAEQAVNTPAEFYRKVQGLKGNVALQLDSGESLTLPE